MRWLSKLTGRDAPPAEPDPALLLLLAEHGLSALEGQIAFGALIGDRDWQFDQDTGVLSFDDSLRFPAQCLGSEADREKTWLWAWANPSIEEPLTDLARRARDVGQQRGWDFLVQPELQLDRVIDGHLVALATRGLLGADAYYRCPYDGGALYLMVALGAETRADRPAVSEVIVSALSIHPALVSRDSIELYVDQRGAAYTTNDEQVIVEDGPTMTFDELGRLTGLEEARTPET